MKLLPLFILSFGTICQGQVFVVAPATNYVTQPRWDDSMVAPLAIKTGASAPTLGQFGASGGLQAYLFQPSSVNDQCWMGFQLQHNVLVGPSDIRVHVHWTQTAAPDAPGNTNVVWGLEYSYGNVWDVFGSVATIYSTNGVHGTNWLHQVSNFPAITNVTQNISGVLNCRLFRAGTDAADTYSENVAFQGADCHYRRDGIGSIEEYVK